MASARETRVDLIRGICLLLIFVGHSRFSFSELFQHGRGFSDASELFVLVAGFSCAMAYYGGAGGPEQRPGSIRFRAALRRAVVIYGVHLACVAALLTVAAIGLALDERDRTFAALQLSPGENLVVALGQAMLLVFMPGDLDILALYVVLLVSFPIAAVLHRRSSELLFAGSVIVWLLAGLFRLNLPNNANVLEHWYFSPFSWQLVFAIGLVIGWRAKRGLEPLPFVRPIFVAALALAAIAIPTNLALYLGLFGADASETLVARALLGKTYLGSLRVLNALAILYVLWHFAPFTRWAGAASAAAVLAAGRNSLPVFTLGIVVSTVFSSAAVLGRSLPILTELALVVAGCALQLAFGVWLENRRKGRASTTGRADELEKAQVLPKSAGG